jgi:putative peptide zinc metalloprotease protein
MSVSPSPDLRLPPLREDLQIVRGGTSLSGEPVWIVLDPVRNRFFRITFEMFQLLTLWNFARSLRGLIQAVQAQFGRLPEQEEIYAAMRMLEASFFVTEPASATWRALHASATRRHSLFMRLIHNYLFFRIPLVRPDRFIRKTAPYITGLFSPTFHAFTICAAILGLYLVSRQWDAFTGTFPYIFTLEGIVVSVISVGFIKSMHELGHAYVAHRHGCRVPTMGIAFMVLVPLLYTDVSDAWRLKSRFDRLKIDTAGVLTEMHIAVFALLLWVFLPDGPFRSAAFVLAATGWVLSLIVNLNPFMRFDGYYIFADLLGVENLQPRAFRHLRWRIRHLLFNTGEERPDRFGPKLDVIVTLYAIATTIYRLFLYFGIALLVYHFTIKIVGVMLFAVEIGFFILRPILSELREWWTMRHDIVTSRRSYLSLAILLAIIALLSLPIFKSVSAPAALYPNEFTRLFPMEPGKIEAIGIKRGDVVKKNDVLFSIVRPELQQELRTTEIEAELTRYRLARVLADPQNLVDRGILQSQLAALEAKRDGLARRQASLIVRAPFDGTVIDIDPQVHLGRWISRKDQLATIAGASGMAARGFLSGGDRGRLDVGATGHFIPDDLTQSSLPVQLTSIASAGASEIDIPQLTSEYHGEIAVHPQNVHERLRLSPVSAQYAITAEVSGKAFSETVRGVVVLNGKGESIAGRVWRQVVKVLVREAGA